MDSKYLIYLSLLFIVLISLTNLSVADCDVWTYSSSNEPVANVTVTYRNISDNVTLSVNTTEVNGRSVHLGNCVNVSITAVYPSSGYSALLSNASVLTEAYINDWVTARVQVKNTLGFYLEGQDCSVSIYRANTSYLVHDYDTLCSIGEPYVDDSGNWVSPTECKFTDSMGWYYFKGEITEDMGFEYDEYYDLIFVCNGKTETVTFHVTLDKQPDVDKVEAFFQKQGGYIVLLSFAAFIILIGIIFLILLWHHAKSKKK